MNCLISNLIKQRGLKNNQPFFWSQYMISDIYEMHKSIFRVNDSGLQTRQVGHRIWINANNLLYTFASGIGKIMTTTGYDLPEIGSEFYYVDEFGKVIKSLLEKSSVHAYLIANGNYYLDKECAEIDAQNHKQMFESNVNYLYRESWLKWTVR